MTSIKKKKLYRESCVGVKQDAVRALSINCWRALQGYKDQPHKTKEILEDIIEFFSYDLIRLDYISKNCAENFIWVWHNNAINVYIFLTRCQAVPLAKREMIGPTRKR